MAVEESLRNTRVQELADLYFERKDGGESVSLADLCEAEPELTPEVMREIHRLLHAERILFGEGGWTFVPSRGVPGRYVVEYADVQNPEPHRSGGMGHLYIARDVETDRRVAYKVLRPELDWPLFRAEFRREAQLTAELHYDGIVPIFGLVSDDPTGLPAYAMDFVEGQTLHEEIRERKWSDARSWRIELTILLRYFLVVCRAVEFAHTQRIRHNDLKSNNVKVTPNREVFVLDWGLAVKTPGEWTSADAARDIVGLGSILHEILTNDTPKTVGKVATDPRVPRAVAPSSRLNGRPVHPHLAAVCRRALSDDPSVRYSTAAALAGDVEAWIEHRAVSAYRDWWPVRGCAGPADTRPLPPRPSPQPCSLPSAAPSTPTNMDNRKLDASSEKGRGSPTLRRRWISSTTTWPSMNSGQPKRTCSVPKVGSPTATRRYCGQALRKPAKTATSPSAWKRFAPTSRR